MAQVLGSPMYIYGIFQSNSVQISITSQFLITPHHMYCSNCQHSAETLSGAFHKEHYKDIFIWMKLLL